MYECAIMNKIVYLIPARALVTPLTRVASLDTPPLSLSLAVGCAHWFPPSVGQHHFTPTGSLCGPGDRPNPPRPRSHQVTHIVRFATHPAQKSISELVRAPKRHFRPLKQLNSEFHRHDIKRTGDGVLQGSCSGPARAVHSVQLANLN